VKSIKNTQIKTSWGDKSRKTLKTELFEGDLHPLRDGEILVKMLYVPIHGSFWLASNPNMVHPRIKEFMESGSFVFGNGGVGVVVSLSKDIKDVDLGDFVTIFGHAPCKHKDCLSCYKKHRYVECDYSEGKIIGHGKKSGDGTYSEYVVLPKYSYEICFRKNEKIKRDVLEALMYAFLFADVRNALTRNEKFLEKRRVLILGAGQSGQLAAFLISKLNPKAKVIITDIDSSRLKNSVKINPQNIYGYKLNEKLLRSLNLEKPNKYLLEKELLGIKNFSKKIFGGKNIDMIFDASSGNSIPLWANTKILSPNSLTIVFGFGSKNTVLDRKIFQISGLEIMVSRGVGNLRNRKDVIDLIKKDGFKFINKNLKNKALELKGLEKAINFIKKHQGKKIGVPQAYIKMIN
jgi:threonine dehydrogenase-like Zn-dependent dehydrogenase